MLLLQAIRSVDIRSPAQRINLAYGRSNTQQNRSIGTAIVIVATNEVAELLYSARKKPELSHADVERITRTKKTVQYWELEQEHEPLGVASMEVVDIDSSERVHRQKPGKYKEYCNYPANTLWSVPVTYVRHPQLLMYVHGGVALRYLQLAWFLLIAFRTFNCGILVACLGQHQDAFVYCPPLEESCSEVL